jgi:CubicO group peptidase (beta-lactamase class C family)
MDVGSTLASEARRLLEAGVAGNVFPGAVACVAWRNGGEWQFAEAWAGRQSAGAPSVGAGTWYDLASLTKSFVAYSALRLVHKSVVTFDARADSLIPDVKGTPGGTATLEQFLRHRSGLAAWGGLYLDVPHEIGTSAARRWMLGEAARRSERAPDEKTVYSDLGYLIAGEMLARAAGLGLDRLVEREVSKPLAIEDRIFYPPSARPEKAVEFARDVAPTERCEWRGRLVRGEVHDENCAAFGGIAGHAGLFGTARAVAELGREAIAAFHGESSLVTRDLFRSALESKAPAAARTPNAPPEASYRLGWDLGGGASSSAGRRMGARTFGHLGFTGTSMWCDPERPVVVVLLSNRVHPSRTNEKIKTFRPAFHDGVMAVIDRH